MKHHTITLPSEYFWQDLVHLLKVLTLGMHVKHCSVCSQLSHPKHLQNTFIPHLQLLILHLTLVLCLIYIVARLFACTEFVSTDVHY